MTVTKLVSGYARPWPKLEGIIFLNIVKNLLYIFWHKNVVIYKLSIVGFKAVYFGKILVKPRIECLSVCISSERFLNESNMKL